MKPFIFLILSIILLCSCNDNALPLHTRHAGHYTDRKPDRSASPVPPAETGNWVGEPYEDDIYSVVPEVGMSNNF